MELAHRLVKWRYPILVLITAALGIFDASSGLSPVDLGTFLRGVERLLSAQWLDTFSEPEMQIGPLMLLVIAFVRAAARLSGLSVEFALGALVPPGVVAALMLTVDRLARGRSEASLLSACAGAVAVASGIAWTAYVSGHPEEVVIGLAWVLVALWSREGRPVAAGLMLAVATALKLSGILGLPLLLFLPTGRDRLRGAVVTAAATTLTYGPFLLFGEVATFDFAWPIVSPLVDALIDSKYFPWWGRVMQGAVTLAAGSIAVRILKDAHIGVWAVPLLMAAVRILFDPLPHDYLWLGFEALLLVGFLELSTRASWPLRIGLALVLYVLMVGRHELGAYNYVWRIAFGIALLVVGRKRLENQIQHQVPGAVRVGNNSPAEPSESG